MTDEPIEAAVIPDRLKRWLNQATSGPLGDVTNALIEQGWSIHPTSQRAFPPGMDPTLGWPCVYLPARLDTDRAVANLVVALRRAGPFDWER